MIQKTIFIFSFIFFLLSFFLPLTAFAAPTLEEIQTTLEAQQASMDHMWTMVAAALVMFMQGGFLLLEAGMVRSKNSINVAQKNIIDFLIAIAVFYLFGFSLMFGTTNGGWFGWDSDLALFAQSDDWHYTFFIFQAVFAGTAGTIVSGAVAERMRFMGYVWITLLIACLIYPVIGHWGWGNLLVGENETYLTKHGFIDFAGSTIVHSVGAWVALAAAIVVGPRLGRFDEHGKVQRMEGHSLVLSTLGCIILWVGWIGFNGGSTTVGSPDFAHIIFNTMIAATFGGITAVIAGRLDDGFYRPDQAINGVLGGLVAITAGCDAVTGLGALIIGASAGVVMHFGHIFLVRNLKIDDVVGAVPVHGFCGAWGTILVAFFAVEDKLGAATRMDQFIIQAEGVLYAFMWAFGTAFIGCKIIDAVFGLRVSEEDEMAGLNVSEHNATLGTGVLQQRLKDVVEGARDLTQRLELETGDEAFEISMYFNQFVGQMQELMHGVTTDAEKLNVESERMTEVAQLMAAASEEVSAQSSVVTTSNKDVADEVDRIATLVEQMGSSINEVSGRAGAMSSSMGNISEAIAHLSNSITEIAEKSRNASDVSTQAHEMAGKASGAVRTLDEAAAKIGEVVQLIKNIADQTNLLALNATIEASRAGDAGRGFAVVANEVKALAGQTAQATEEISARIGKIQGTTSDVSDTIDKVTCVIDSIHEAVSGISSLTVEQDDRAGQIASNVNETTGNAQSIAESIASISENTEQVTQSARLAASNAKDVHENMQAFNQEAAQSSESAQTMHSSSTEVKDVAQKLKEATSQYKVS